MESEARAKAETDDLMSKIESLTAGFEGAKDRSSVSSSSNPAVAAAFAAAEAGARGSGQRRRSNSCVIVAPPNTDGPIASALVELLGGAGWAVHRLSAALDTLGGVVEAQSGDVGMDIAIKACQEGAVLVLCPDDGADAAGAKAKSGGSGGDFFGKALSALAGGGGGGASSKVPLAAVDTKAVQKLIGSYLEGTPSQVVMVSEAGVDRADKFPYSIANVGGALDKRRAAEQAVMLMSLQYGFDYSILRIGGVVSSTESGIVLRPGDSLDDSVTVAAASRVLFESITAQPAARNATFCMSGGVKSGGGSQEDWDDHFLRIDGPELLRSDVSKGGSRSMKAATVWAQNWAQEWTKPGTGLTTKVRIKETTPKGAGDGGGGGGGVVYSVGLFFDPAPGLGGGFMSSKDEKALEAERDGRAASGTSKRRKRSRVGLEGGIEVIVDSLSSAEPNSPRIRARRFAYGDGITAKEMSEETILRRLKSDLKRWG